MSIIETLLSLLFPERCVGCSAPGVAFCSRCRAALAPYADDIPAALATQHETRILFVYQGCIRSAVHLLKYRRQRRAARPLGALLAEDLARRPLPIDAIAAIPLHQSRQATRGFNQAEALAAEVSRRCGAPLIGAELQRVRATEQQAKLDARQRAANVRDAFRWCAPYPPPRRILLVDDVLTTGATMGACTEALLAAGAHEVSGIALARSRLADPSYSGIGTSRRPVRPS
jgi:ComF family protein